MRRDQDPSKSNMRIELLPLADKYAFKNRL
jgi:hypothetical protein